MFARAHARAPSLAYSLQAANRANAITVQTAAAVSLKPPLHVHLSPAIVLSCGGLTGEVHLGQRGLACAEMTSGVAQLPVRVRPARARRRVGWRLCLLAAGPRALAAVTVKSGGSVVRVKPTLGPEDSPQVLASSGDLVVAWKPPKLSMRRRMGGEPSDLEAWAAAAAGAATAVTTLGRGIGGLVLLSRRRESAKETAAAIRDGRAKATLHAVVQGEPEEAAVCGEGPGHRLEVVEACEGLKLGRLSLLKATVQYEEGIEKQAGVQQCWGIRSIN
ncbi:unnamed protein product [Symbiodinium natans]|uniref:Uncharacterized protein n=1 Tax=Symbiodinium natans TaxID=878477 RepID=A0A812QYB5_9DINO|nr:unnamed protein product [Symbiodinium natans]